MDLVSECPICCNSVTDDEAKIRLKGLQTLIRCSEARGDEKMTEYFRAKSETDEPVKVIMHAACRKTYTRLLDVERAKRYLEGNAPTALEPIPKKLRSMYGGPFPWKTHCLLCGEVAEMDKRHPDRTNVYEIRTFSVRETLLYYCRQRNDSWARDVDLRIAGCSCLVAAEGRYHHGCYKQFARAISTYSESGRPMDNSMHSWFLAMCDWLEHYSEAELYTLDELMDTMRTLACGEEIYSKKMLKVKLYEQYGDHVFFASVGGGRQDIVCFRNMANFIVHKQWHQQKQEDEQRELDRFMRTCARVIKEEIRERNYERQFPTLDEIRDSATSSEFITPCLGMLLKFLIPNELKRNVIGQMICQAVRPRTVISPLLFGLGVEVDHIFGSKWLTDELFSLGMSVSYDEIRMFKSSIIQDENLGTVTPEAYPAFTQWSADNADSTIATIDGGGQFHAIGIIAMTAKSSPTPSDYRIKRRARIRVDDLINGKKIQEITYIAPAMRAMSQVKFKPIVEHLTPLLIPPPAYYTNILWQGAHRGKGAVPNWSGYMQHIHKTRDDEAQKWDVMILPIINLSPSDDTGIYTTLICISEQSDKLGLPSCAITFDQPLYIKASEIVEAKGLKKIVLRLGGFHLLMSAIGAIFHTMTGSGIEEALELIYGENVVKHIMSGKAYERAMRAMTLLDATLTAILLTKVKNDPENGMAEDEFNELDVMFRKSLDDPSLVDEVCTSEKILLLKKLDCLIREKRLDLENKSRTAKLWSQFQYYVSCLKNFITAERLSNWKMHLDAVKSLLNVFAASNHHHYAKSSRLYLQRMLELEVTHPWLYEKFSSEGLHAVRRSQRYWAGLSTDLVIEQVMMRAMKCRGGLTHGRGLTESITTQWVYTLHTFAAVHDAMTTVTGRKLATSNQHVEMGAARSERDGRDFQKLFDWFEVNDPYHADENYELHSITSGIVATENDNITCDRAEEIGRKIHAELDSVSITSAKIRKCDTVRTLKDLQPGLKLEKETIQIDPSVLFMRCTTLAARENTDEVQYYAYEMTPVPTSLFKDGLMRKAVKSELTQYIEKQGSNVFKDDYRTDNMLCIIDGGWLLYQIRWTAGKTYNELAENYDNFVHDNFGSSVIIFDGYDSKSIKDHEHIRRAGKMAPNVKIGGRNEIYPDREAFLRNLSNKSNLIRFLSGWLVHRHKTVLCEADADNTVVKTALKYSEEKQVVCVVCNDTDIIVSLIYHWKNDMEEVYIRKDTRKRERQTIKQLFKISDIHKTLDPMVIKYLLFIHSWSGCDTTSSTFQHGKLHVLKMLQKSVELQRAADVMMSLDASADEIQAAGLVIFIRLYGGNSSDNLCALRYRKFQSMISKSKKLEPQRLPPTEGASNKHSLRVHLQIVRWISMDDRILNAEEWGWKIHKDKFMPIMTDLNPAPDKLLKVIRCNCQTMCSTQSCSCRKNGIKCVQACGGCGGRDCDNFEVYSFDDVEDDDV